MTTSNRPQFGIFPTPHAASVEEDLRLIRHADKLSLDLVRIRDHRISGAFSTSSR